MYTNVHTTASTSTYIYTSICIYIYLSIYVCMHACMYGIIHLHLYFHTLESSREASPMLVLANMESMQQPDRKPACGLRQCCFFAAGSTGAQENSRPAPCRLLSFPLCSDRLLSRMFRRSKRANMLMPVSQSQKVRTVCLYRDRVPRTQPDARCFCYTSAARHTSSLQSTVSQGFFLPQDKIHT